MQVQIIQLTKQNQTLKTELEDSRRISNDSQIRELYANTAYLEVARMSPWAFREKFYPKWERSDDSSSEAEK